MDFQMTALRNKKSCTMRGYLLNWLVWNGFFGLSLSSMRRWLIVALIVRLSLVGGVIFVYSARTNNIYVFSIWVLFSKMIKIIKCTCLPCGYFFVYYSNN